MTHKVKTISYEFLVLLSFFSIVAILLIYIFFLTREIRINLCVILGVNILSIILIHRLCSGVILLHLENDLFEIKWISKPLISTIKNQKIKFDEIRKWDNIGNPKSPDSLLIVLKDRRKIRIWFRLFATKNNYGDFKMDFVKWININRKVFQDTEKDITAVNNTEDFYNSNKTKIFSTLLLFLFISDIALIILNTWNARLVYIMFLIPLIFVSMFHLIGSVLNKK